MQHDRLTCRESFEDLRLLVIALTKFRRGQSDLFAVDDKRRPVVAASEQRTDGRFYDYDAKYAPGGSIHVLPAKISSFVYQNVQMLALRAHRALGCRGVSRADFRFDEKPDGNGPLVCLEVNTQPGMTPTSLVPELAQHAGHSFEELVTWMVNDASVDR